jgi:hypothetical protein
VLVYGAMTFPKPNGSAGGITPIELPAPGTPGVLVEDDR